MPDHEETLDPARTEEVRRLLADARHSEPTPDEVVARLDAVLDDLRGDLNGETSAGAPSSGTPAAAAAAPAGVVSLAARRRRRAAALLVAAAVVVVGGFAVPRLTGSGGSVGDSAASSADSARLGNTGDRGAAQQSGPEASASAGSSPQSPSGGVGQEGASAPPTAQQFQSRITVVVRPSHFADDVAAARRLVATAAAAPRADSARVQDCAPVSGRGDVVAVRYAGAVGALVFRPPTADSQVADLYICGTADPVRSITLPRP